MITTSTAELSFALQSAFECSSRGVIGLVEDLLKLCQKQSLQLDWKADSCRVRSIGDGAIELLNCPLHKSVFRAMLARVAALCNERSPNSVSPYGGQGEIVVNTEPPTSLRVSFTNTADEQTLQLCPSHPREW